MPALTTTRNYADAQVLDEQDLDDAFDSIETLLNTTKLDGDNLQTGGVPTAALANLAVTTAKIDALAVTTAKLDDASVTSAKLAAAVAGDGLAGGAGTALSVNVDGTTLEINSDALRIKDLGVSTAKLAALAVTREKQEAVGQQLSSSSGAFTRSNSSYGAVNNLSCTITTSGRPVFVGLVSDGGGSSSFVSIYASGGAATRARTGIIIKRDSSTIAEYTLGGGGSSSASLEFFYGPSDISHLDTPAAGTYTYTVQSKTIDSNNEMSVTNVKLLVYEL